MNHHISNGLFLYLTAQATGHWVADRRRWEWDNLPFTAVCYSDEDRHEEVKMIITDLDTSWQLTVDYNADANDNFSTKLMGSQERFDQDMMLTHIILGITA